MSHPLYMGCDGHISPDELDVYEKTGKYVAEPKRDGNWGIVKAVDREQRIWGRSGLPQAVEFPQLPAGTVIVGELGIGQQAALERQKSIGHEFMDVYDILRIDYKDITEHDDPVRRNFLKSAYDSWSDEAKEWFLLNPRWNSNFRFRYGREDEGLVLKLVKGMPTPYKGGTRSPYWIKCKREMTVDMIVMGWQETGAVTFKKKGLRAAKYILCGVLKDGKLVSMVKVGSMPHQLKIDIAADFKKYKWKVAEIKCNKVFKSGSLRHPSFVRFRTDKKTDDCTWESLLPLINVGKGKN